MRFTSPGPFIARAYLRGLALVSLVAWVSIGSQLLLLIGAHGLLPIAPLLDEARRQHVTMHEVPTLFWVSASDAMLIAVTALGAAASLFGVLRCGRAWLVVSLPLYLSVCVAAQDFCGFQWDILLLEASFVGLFIDPLTPSRAAMWLPRLLLVKLYLESGISKLLSPVGDWLSGSAMVAYFETAPLPTPLARYAHALPLGMLHASTWLTLVVEIVVPLLAFGPRVGKRIAFVVLGAFQLANVLTANYGFFVPLALLLHLFLLDDETFGKIAAPVRRSSIALVGLIAWSALSVLDGVLLLTGVESPALLAIHELHAPYRVIGTYHLFASVTTERIEPTFFVRTGEDWTELALHDKPGPIDRRLPFVAPHQPRIDFQLWFHGLHTQGRLPGYLAKLEVLLCDEPARVQSLFSTPLPDHPDAIQLRYARYRFTKPGSADIWTREWTTSRPEHPCRDAEAGDTLHLLKRASLRDE